jgi:hypothetical protein
VQEQSQGKAALTRTNRWSLGKVLFWDLRSESHLPHRDRVEMSGRQISVVIHYGADEKKRLILEREIIWPRLRVFPNDTFGSLGRFFDNSMRALFQVDGALDLEEKLVKVEFDGLLRLITELPPGIEVVRTLFPSENHGALIENFTVTNQTERSLLLKVTFPEYEEETLPGVGVYAIYRIKGRLDRTDSIFLHARETAAFSIYWTGDSVEEPIPTLNAADEEHFNWKLPNPSSITCFCYRRFALRKTSFLHGEG